MTGGGTEEERPTVSLVREDSHCKGNVTLEYKSETLLERQRVGQERVRGEMRERGRDGREGGMRERVGVERRDRVGGEMRERVGGEMRERVGVVHAVCQ